MYSLHTDIPGKHPFLTCKHAPYLLIISDQLRVVTTQNHKLLLSPRTHARGMTSHLLKVSPMNLAARVCAHLFGQNVFMWRDDTFNIITSKEHPVWFILFSIF